jgi:hypothetical protein
VQKVLDLIKAKNIQVVDVKFFDTGRIAGREHDPGRFGVRRVLDSWIPGDP